MLPCHLSTFFVCNPSATYTTCILCDAPASVCHHMLRAELLLHPHTAKRTARSKEQDTQLYCPVQEAFQAEVAYWSSPAATQSFTYTATPCMMNGRPHQRWTHFKLDLLHGMLSTTITMMSQIQKLITAGIRQASSTCLRNHLRGWGREDMLLQDLYHRSRKHRAFHLGKTAFTQ